MLKFGFFFQNAVSGPLKRHDGGWKCLIIQKKCQILSNLVEILSNLVKFCNIYSKFCQDFDIFLQNPGSGPLKRHDGGWKCVIIQQKIVKFGHILQVKHKKGFFSAKILIFFLQNPVSGPLKRHDGGWKCLIIQKKCQI